MDLEQGTYIAQLFRWLLLQLPLQLVENEMLRREALELIGEFQAFKRESLQFKRRVQRLQRCVEEINQRVKKLNERVEWLKRRQRGVENAKEVKRDVGEVERGVEGVEIEVEDDVEEVDIDVEEVMRNLQGWKRNVEEALKEVARSKRDLAETNRDLAKAKKDLAEAYEDLRELRKQRGMPPFRIDLSAVRLSNTETSPGDHIKYPVSLAGNPDLPVTHEQLANLTVAGCEAARRAIGWGRELPPDTSLAQRRQDIAEYFGVRL